jgi:hypothetical protein
MTRGPLAVIDQGIETDRRTDVRRIPSTSLQTLPIVRNARRGLVKDVLALAHAEIPKVPLWRNLDAWTRKMIKSDVRDANGTEKAALNDHKVID